MNIGPILSKELSLLVRAPGTWVVGAVHLFVQGLIFALLVITIISVNPSTGISSWVATCS